MNYFTYSSVIRDSSAVSADSFDDVMMMRWWCLGALLGMWVWGYKHLPQAKHTINSPNHKLYSKKHQYAFLSHFLWCGKPMFPSLVLDLSWGGGGHWICSENTYYLQPNSCCSLLFRVIYELSRLLWENISLPLMTVIRKGALAHLLK